jgi:Ca2+-binding EF-hand superfamily protein/chromosome segregation ATPase
MSQTEIVRQNQRIQKLVDEHRDMNHQIENLLAENALLRQLSKVPDNFGDQLEIYKKKQKDNALFYKHNNDVLMKEIENLEKEKTQLHYELRKWKTTNPGAFEFMDGLTEDQKQAVLNWVINLKQGKQDIPLTEKSESLRAEILRLQDRIAVYEEVLEKGRDGQHGSQLDANQLQTILDAIKKQGTQMENIFASGRFGETIQGQPQETNTGAMNMNQTITNINKPPKPLAGIFGDWTEVNEGYSYKFNSKLQVKSYDEELANMDMDKAKYYIAALQLHNMESMELLHQREQEFNLISQELMEVRNHLREALLVQDEIFTKHHFELANFETKMTSLKRENYDLKTEFIQANKKVEIFEGSFTAVQSKNSSLMESRLAEMTKIAALAETNIVKLSRKYDALETEHDQFLSTWNVSEKDKRAREYEMEESLNNLLKWKTDATEKITILLERITNSVPIEEHNSLKAEFELERQKYAALKANENIVREQNIKLQGSEREKNEVLDEMHKLEEEISAIEAEYAVLHLRLCALDKTYERHTLVFKNIANILKQKNISPLQYFQAADTNRDGNLVIQEFGRALLAMGVQLGEGELEEFYTFMDIDTSGSIDYKEFCRKLKRYGVVLRSAEEELVNTLWNAITKVYMTLEQAFKAFDQRGLNELTFVDMNQAFKELGIDVDSRTASEFFKLADVTGNGKISCAEFCHVFSRFNKRDRNVMAPDSNLNWKLDVMAKLEELCKEKNVSLEQIYQDIDKDRDSRVNFDEFRLMFTKMQLNFEKKALEQLFNEIDNNRSGVITFSEFLSYVNFAKKESERVKRMKAYEKTINGKGGFGGDSMILDGDFSTYADPTTKYQLKIAQLESKQSTFMRKQAEDIKKINHLEDEQVTLRANIKSLESTLLNTQQQLITEKEKNGMLAKQAQSVIPKEQAAALKAMNENLRIESTQLRSALDTFRNLHEAAVREAKSLRLSVGRSDDEIIHLRKEIRELQALSDENALIGKLFNQVLTEKWTEASFNRKYDQIIDDFRKSQLKVQNLEKKVADKENEIMNLHIAKDEHNKQLNRQLFEARMSILPTVTLAKLEELNLALKRIGNQKLELEIANKQLRAEGHENQVKLDHYVLREKNLIDLEDSLKIRHPDELSMKIIELSEKLSQYKLAELKAQREVGLIKEREEYFMRVNKNQTEQIVSLEEQVAKCDEKMVLREKMWREKYQELLKVTPKVMEQAMQNKPSSGTLNSATIHDMMRDGVNSLPEKDREVMLSPTATKRSGVGFGNLSHSVLESEHQILLDKVRLLEDDVRLRDIKLEKLEKELQTRHVDINYRTNNVETFAISDLENKTAEIATAAKHTVITLQTMIEDKARLLNEKEKKIDDLRNDLTEKAKEMSRLELENENLRRQISTSERNKMSTDQLTALKTIEKLSNLDQKEMERIVVNYEQKLQLMAEYVAQVEKDNRELAKKASSARFQRDQLENTKTVEANLQELDRLKKDLAKMTDNYHKERTQVKNMNKVLSEYTQDLDKMKEEVTKTKVEESQKVLVEKNGKGLYEERIGVLDAKFKTLQADFQKETKKVKDLQAAEIRYRTQITELTEQLNKTAAMNLKLKEDNSKLGQIKRPAPTPTNLPTVPGNQKRPPSASKTPTGPVTGTSAIQTQPALSDVERLELEQLRTENARLKVESKLLREQVTAGSISGYELSEVHKQELVQLRDQNERLETEVGLLRQAFAKGQTVKPAVHQGLSKTPSSSITKQDSILSGPLNIHLQEINKLREENDKLAHSLKELREKLAAQQSNADFIDADGNLYQKDAMSFTDREHLIGVFQRYFNTVGKDLNLFEIMKKADPFGTGFAPTESVLAQLAKAGIKFKERDCLFIPKYVPKNAQGQMNYKEFYYMVKGNISDASIQTSGVALPHTHTSSLTPSTIQERQPPITKPGQKPVDSSYHTAVLDRNVDLLKKKLMEKDREMEDLNKQLKTWRQTALQYENELKEKANSSRYANMSINATLEAKIGRKGENLKQIQELEDQVRTLKSEMQYEITKREQVIKELQEDITRKTYEQTMAQSEAQNLRAQLDRVLSSRLQKDHLWDEREKEKDVLVASLMERLDKSRKQEEDIRTKLRAIEKENIELKHVKEGINTRLENMNREIRELKEKKKFE